jgi:hypothetical protein
MGKPTITLPPQTVFVETADVPKLISKALHPHPEDQSVKVIGLYNNLKNRTAAEISPTHDSSISNYQWKILKEIFKDLPPLKFPLTEPQWKTYEKAFQVGGKNRRWELIPEYSSPSLTSKIYRRHAHDEHLSRLREEIRTGRLEQLDPKTNIPARRYRDDGKVTVSALKAYAKKFSIKVALEKQSTAGVRGRGHAISAEAPSWKEEAQRIAKEYIDKHYKKDLHPSQNDVCAAVEKTMRQMKIYGPHKTPLTANYIKRNAIQGKWWQGNK